MKKIIVFIFTLSIFAVSAWALTFPQPAPDDNPQSAAADALPQEPPPKPKLTLSFSETDFFYDRDITVTITPSIPEAEVYYTTDGAQPTSESKKYVKSLEFNAADGISCVVLKAIAVYENTQTSPLVHTYFPGKDVASRFETLVFSVSTNEEHLYDYDKGIFVPGRLRDDYVAANPNRKIDPPAPANFNLRGMEGERPVYVEVFTKDGTRVVAQAAGVRVSGGWSRAETQKSLRLIARNMYEPGVGKFHYAFFPGETKRDGYNTPLDKYDTIVLRNGANDRDFGMLRNEVASILARDAGFLDVTPFAAAAVFVNGEYYGFAWAQTVINEQYLQDVYDAPTKEFDVIGDGDSWYNTDNIAAKRSLMAMNAYAEGDLTDDAIFAELEAMADIDNMLLYYAFETYMDNDDWPQNNLKRWRYTGPELEGAAKELDGRWRYIMYDLDWTLGLYDGSYTRNSVTRVLNSSKLLAALLKRKDMSDRFAAYICALSDNVITKENVEDTINEVFSQAEYEIDKAFEARKYASWTNKENVFKNHAHMIKYAQNRGDAFKGFLTGKFALGELFEIKITGGEANFGAGPSDGASFFDKTEVRVSPVLPRFAVFEHWLLNGTKTLYEDEIIISGFQAINGVVSLEIVSRIELPRLEMSDAYSGRAGNGVTLKNPNSETVTTGGLYLSDDRDNLLRFELPILNISPDESISFAGKGSTSAGDLFKLQLPFRISPGEVLFLSDGDCNVIDHVTVPQ